MKRSPPSIRPARFVRWLLAGLSLGVGGALAQQPAAEGDPAMLDGIVTLSPYEVTANSAEFEHWIKVGSPHFVVYTDARVKDALTVLQQMEMLYIAIQGFIGRQAVTRAPMTFVLPTARSDWRKLQSKGGVEWKVAMSTTGGAVVDIAIAQYDWQDDGFDLVWSALGRTMTEWLNIDTAFWFGRGIGSFFETANFTKDSVKLGQVNVRTIYLVTEGWMPWARFFAVNARSPEFTKDSDVMRQYIGQCAAFVQFMLANQDPVWVGRLLVWNALHVAGREPSEELFKQLFGQDWKEWDATMKEYITGGTYTVLTLGFPPALLEVPRSQLNLGTTEMRELFVLTQILNQDVPASDAALDSVLARGLKTESLREMLVEACLDRHHKDAALEQLRRLIDAGSTNPAVYAHAARMEFERLVAGPSPYARLDAEAAAPIRRWCQRALELEPLQVEANVVLAWTEALGPTVAPENLAAVGRICRTLDGNATTDLAIAALAVARWRAGEGASARKACRLLLDSPFGGDEARAVATAVLGELDSPPTIETSRRQPAGEI